MEKFILGLFLVFFKTNLDFIDSGIVYYATNFFGYGLMYLGVRDLKAGHEKMGKVQPLVIVMICHSIFFFVLNSTGHSAGSIPLSTAAGFALSISLLALAAVGTMMVTIILSLFISAMSDRLYSISRLEVNVGLMLGSMVLASVLVFTLQPLAYFSMGLVLLVQLVFIIRLYKMGRSRNDLVSEV
ncbi:hypothetical protein MHZ92_04640 [Sporosarcina sp. ACRSL]|uniref:hypothetical protein n=1 Tax=Sporosarcina sp. ACRSL TaxID=2918215 RepID=UPI001EF668DC|nr:hypothetical protein [Sporosarcina sp. ACRSL]MCG7343406.1 hypothetical protein [Sporosarcina sp. ACRSL]